MKFIDIQNGVPYDLVIREGETMYFYYYHAYNLSYTVNALTDSGKV